MVKIGRPARQYIVQSVSGIMGINTLENSVSEFGVSENNNNNVASETVKGKEFQNVVSEKPPKMEIVWKNVVAFFVLHYIGLVGVYYLMYVVNFLTAVYNVALIFATGMLGVTAGAHRYFTHRSYKATTPLKILLMVFQTLSSQNCIWIWARDHRLHHKYTDTDADPHNARRGFFFSHVGWLLVRKHPDVKLKGPSVDMSDLDADPIVMFQKKYYYWMYFLLNALPPLVPWYFFGESLYGSFLTAYFARILISLHGTWCVNSWAHKYGSRPFSKQLLATETTFVAGVAFGEGWHNYHHTFPWDYKASEMGKLNTSTALIHFFAALGMAYDMKSATKEMIEHRVNKYGDGTREIEYEELLRDMNSGTS